MLSCKETGLFTLFKNLKLSLKKSLRNVLVFIKIKKSHVKPIH